MRTSTINKSQRKAARVAGLAFLITFATVVYVNFGIYGRLIVKNNTTETARNILTHEQLFRIGIAGNLFYCMGVVVLLTALYVILKPVSRGLTLLATIWRLIWVFMWLIMTLNLFDTLRFLGDDIYLRAFEGDRLRALASFRLASSIDYYYVGLLFGACASTLSGYLWLKSRYIPRVLAVFGMISSAFCVACTFIFFIFPNFDKIVNLWWFDTPMAIFDIALSFWLLFKGLRSVETAEPESASG